jgi:hypothetical protein
MNAASTSAVWITESSQGMQTAYGVVGAIVGVSCIFGSHIQGIDQGTSTAALLLGLLVLVVSLATLALGGKHVVSVDPRRMLVEIAFVSRFGTKTRRIPFPQISEVSLGELGDKEGGSVIYHVVLKLEDGEEIALFLGAFGGTRDRHVMDDRRRRLAAYLESSWRDS